MWRKTGVVFVLILLIAVVVLFGMKKRWDSHFYDGYSPEHALNIEVSESVDVNSTVEAFGQVIPARYRRIAFAYDSQPGERVPAILTMPLDASAPAPVLVLLHGSHQEKEFVEQICTPFNEAGFAMVSFDQYTRGERHVEGNTLRTALAFRDRCRKTVHDTRRLIDYLETRPDIDGKRVYLVGASYGAITGTVAVAQEPRIQAAAMVVGGGDFHLVAQAPRIRRELPGWMLPFAGHVLTFLAGVADPVHHASQTAGTPILMLNGSEDGVISPASGEALYAALGEPKEIRWYPVDHPDVEPDGAKVLEMLADGLAWFRALDASFNDSQVIALDTARGAYNAL